MYLLDLNAYHRILELHENEDLVIVFVGDNHRLRLAQMLQATNYSVDYTTSPLNERKRVYTHR